MFEALGGRKFLMVIAMVSAAAAIEIYGKNGLSTNMAGLIIGLYTAFSAANVITTVKALAADGSAQQASEASAPQPAAPSPQVEGALAHLVQKSAENEAASQQLQASLASVQKTLVALISR